MSSLWLRERLGFMQWLAIALAFAGLIHVVIKGQWIALAQVRLVARELWILAATVSWTLYSIFLKRWPSAFSPMAQLDLTISGGVLLLMPLTVLEALSGLPMTHTIWGWKTFVLAITAALMPGAGAYPAYATLQKSLGVLRASLTLHMGPLYAVVTAFSFQTEPVHFYHLMGAIIL